MEFDDDFAADYDDSGNESSEDDENLDFAIEPEVSDSSLCFRDTEKYKYDVLSADAIINDMLESIKEVSTVINLATPTTRILLNYFKWDKEKLMERFYGDDQDKLFEDAHIVNPYRATVVEKPTAKCSPGLLECDICCLKIPVSTMSGIECGHLFCLQCWTQYLKNKIIDEGMGQSIACPAYDCGILVDDQTVMKLLNDPKVKLKYQQHITKSFVECNKLLRWCPYPDCGYAIKVKYPEARPVVCKCGNCFCFRCGENWHDPVQCHLLKKWIKKCDDDSETSNWIAANTKECPKCKITIEKDGGCNHMICKNTSCKADFCWVCLGPWEPHGSSWYSCNRYDESEAKQARDAQEKSRAALQRYLFYCNRYMSHMQSLKFENKLYASIRDKMEEMQNHNMSWIEVQFLKKAVDILCSCRETLMFTYIFAFYLVRSNQSAIFEDNQKDVETATEVLSEYLERDITQENVDLIKQKVQDKYRYCEQRRRKLLEHVYEGYEKDWWEYSD